MPAPVIQVFSDYACPFCYLAEPGLRALSAAGVTVRHRAFELRPAPVPLEPPGSDAAKRAGWAQMVAPMAERLGITMRFPPLAVRTRKAHEAVAYARRHDLGGAMHDALFAAYFEDGRDIGRIDVLVEIGAGIGLDRTGLKVSLDIDQHTAEVEADEGEARALRIAGVPAYIGEDLRPPRLVGTQDYETLKAWVETRA